VLVSATAEVRENIGAELPRFRCIREKHGWAVPDYDAYLRALMTEGRVLLAFTLRARRQAGPPGPWTRRPRSPRQARSRRVYLEISSPEQRARGGKADAGPRRSEATRTVSLK